MGLCCRYLSELLGRISPTDHYMLAISGGPDSLALAHLFASIATKDRLHLSACYVDHGLHASSALWGEHCAHYCASLGLPFQKFSLQIPLESGQSLEAQARQMRYDCLAQALAPAQALITAHHLDDQAETFLLQLLRGAGLKGLSAMPQLKTFSTGYHLRPLLDISREQILQYCQRYQIEWLLDPSNRDEKFNRNYIRAQVTPVLRQRWPSAARTISRAASHLAHAQQLLEEYGYAELPQFLDASGEKFNIELARSISTDRLKHLLKLWLRQLDLPQPSQTQLRMLIQTMWQAERQAQPMVQWTGVQIRRFRGELYAGPPLTEMDLNWSCHWDLTKPLALPGGLGQLRATRGQSGLTLSETQRTTIELAFYQGGERLLMRGDFHTSLKKWFQQQHQTPWQRRRLPLVKLNGEIVQILGTSYINHKYYSGSEAWSIDWQSE